MDSLKNVIRHARLGRRYAVVEGKENSGYTGTPSSAKLPARRAGLAENRNEERPHLRRNTSVTQSMRDAVGTIRQKLKKSTRQRKRLQDGINSPATPRQRKNKTTNKTPTRRGGYREVRMYSPFGFESPAKPMERFGRPNPMRWSDIETPTKLRKEVEDLTANMQALVALSPRTLQSKSRSRRSLASPMASTRRTPRSSRNVVKSLATLSRQVTEL